MAKKMTEAQAEAYKARRELDIERMAQTLHRLIDDFMPDWQIHRQRRKLIDRCAAYKRDYG